MSAFKLCTGKRFAKVAYFELCGCHVESCAQVVPARSLSVEGALHFGQQARQAGSAGTGDSGLRVAVLRDAGHPFIPAPVAGLPVRRRSFRKGCVVQRFFVPRSCAVERLLAYTLTHLSPQSDDKLGLVTLTSRAELRTFYFFFCSQDQEGDLSRNQHARWAGGPRRACKGRSSQKPLISDKDKIPSGRASDSGKSVESRSTETDSTGLQRAINS